MNPLRLSRCFRFRSGSAILFAGLLLVGEIASRAAEPAVDDLLKEAQTAFRQGDSTNALALATKAIAAAPKNPQAHFLRASLHAALRRYEPAVADFSAGLKLDPQATGAWQQRGVAYFKLGKMNESIADFDQVIALVPEQAPHHWQRGICYYYAGRFVEGRKQFELHQTVNKNDVENAVWHFLCVTRAAGVEPARAALIPISGDSRVPMAQVHELFAGKLKPAAVLAAAQAGDPPAARLSHQLFYAHLYLGLYFEAIGDAKQARDYIFKAAAKADENDYMGDVARVHAELLRKQEKK